MQEMNIVVAGMPFSGTGTVARLIYGNWKGFKYIDMNYLIDSLYNDFLTIRQHKGQARMMIRSSVILKNAEYLYRSIGIPEFIASQKMWEWMKFVDDETISPIKFKRAIWRTMCEFNHTWRGIYARERMIERPSDRYVFSHMYSEEELEFAKNPIILWVDSTEISISRHAYQSNCRITLNDLFAKEYRKFDRYCRQNANFIIYNNDGIKELELQLEDLRKALEIERNDKKPIRWYRK